MLIRQCRRVICQSTQRSSWFSRDFKFISSLSFNKYSQNENLEKNLIIMHGLFGSKSNWTSLSKAFAKSTNPPRNIISIDARNHGLSPHVDSHSYELMAQDIGEFMKENKLEKSAVLGHSMGGRSMMTFALHNPEMVEKLVVVDISPVGRIGTTQSNIPLFIKAMRSISISNDLTIHQGRKIADQKLQEIISEKSLRDFLITNLAKTENNEFTWRINLETLEKCFDEGISKFPKVDGLIYEGETLFIGGTRSDYMREADIPAIQKLFPKAQFKFLDCGHWVHAEKPEQFLKLVLEFLNK